MVCLDESRIEEYMLDSEEKKISTKKQAESDWDPERELEKIT